MPTQHIPVIIKRLTALAVALTLSVWVVVAGAESTPNELLIKAAAHGRVMIVKKLLEKGVDVNSAGQDGVTALIHASAAGHLEIVRLLMDNGAEVNAKDKKGWTPLMAAVRNGNAKIVKLLVDRQADPNAQDEIGLTPLVMTALLGDAEAARVLLENGADINAADALGLTPLMMASWHGKIEIVRILLEYGVDVNVMSHHGTTALAMAASKGHVQIAELLKNRGATSGDRAMIIWTAKFMGILIILALIAGRRGDRPFDQPFFENQKWTMNDVCKIMLPVLAFVYVQSILLHTLTQYAMVLAPIFSLTNCIAIYGFYYLFIGKPYGVSLTAFGLGKERLFESGVRHANFALIFALYFIIFQPRLPLPPDPLIGKQINLVSYLGIVQVLLVCLVGPVLEELLFRGILFCPVARKTGKWSAIVLLSVLFALSHLQSNQIQTLGVVIISFLLYCAYIKTTSLYAPIVWHAVINLMSLRLTLASAAVGHIDTQILDRYCIWGLIIVLLTVNFPRLVNFLRNPGSNHAHSSNRTTEEG